MSDELPQRGKEIRAEVIGRERSEAALGKPDELRIHCRGALTNGVTRDEIQEVFLKLCIYAGVPSAGEAFKVAREVFEEPEFAAKG
jgi:alkylhydroperoxidase/carboxymuconolactone decarboxylase family protein YurZ